jgi:heme/copper-type cytochrome/quinol oxidase subunit 3
MTGHGLGRLQKIKVAMGLYLVSELVFFLMLGIAYVFYRDEPGLHAAARPLDARITGVYTVALLSSSGTWLMAERSARYGRRIAMRWWMGATLVLGGTFLVGQAREYTHLFSQGVTIAQGGLFGTTFFTLTGFHGLHVLFGLVTLGILGGLACGRRPAWPPAQALETAGWYWHFVDGVWVVIYSVVYLWP